jgi:HK97 family phage prohead protease
MITEQVKYENIEGKADIVADEPTYKVIRDADGNIVDYLDVKIEGYANTFAIDRGNDMTIPGCFIEHLGEYKENPILLADHERTTKNAVGRVFSAYEDEKGLKISARISNAPDVRNLRFKIAEKVLRTLSIGGLFHVKMGKDKNYINKVELREISVVTVPMNKQSMFAIKNSQDQHSLNNPALENKEPEKAADGLDKDASLWVEINKEKYKLID